MNHERFAIVAASPKFVAPYLPDNYEVVGITPGGTTLIGGYDFAGWTLEDYVIPRLASGLHWAKPAPPCFTPDFSVITPIDSTPAV